MKVYCYKKCSTCEKTIKLLKENGISFTELAIRETPPSVDELRFMLKTVGNIKKMMNTSSADYREKKSDIDKMSESEILKLLNTHGNLVKRPFIIDGQRAWVGHQAEMLS